MFFYYLFSLIFRFIVICNNLLLKWCSSDEYIEPFLDEYRKKKCLWNISNDSYTNQDRETKRTKKYVPL